MIPLNIASYCLETVAGERSNGSPLSFGAPRLTNFRMTPAQKTIKLAINNRFPRRGRPIAKRRF